MTCSLCRNHPDIYKHGLRDGEARMARAFRDKITIIATLGKARIEELEEENAKLKHELEETQSELASWRSI